MDISTTIAPKSDQLNYDDFIGKETMTIKVTKVTGSDDKQQPIAINYEGDNGKPYKPCLSMRRLLVAVWGKDGTAYVGRSMTLYGDPSVKFGGIAVGGIRISHVSDIDKPFTMALSVSKANKKLYTVKPIGDNRVDAPIDPTNAIAALKACTTLGELKTVYSALSKAEQGHADIVKVKDEMKLSIAKGGGENV